MENFPSSHLPSYIYKTLVCLFSQLSALTVAIDESLNESGNVLVRGGDLEEGEISETNGNSFYESSSNPSIVQEKQVDEVHKPKNATSDQNGIAGEVEVAISQKTVKCGSVRNLGPNKHTYLRQLVDSGRKRKSDPDSEEKILNKKTKNEKKQEEKNRDGTGLMLPPPPPVQEPKTMKPCLKYRYGRCSEVSTKPNTLNVGKIENNMAVPAVNRKNLRPPIMNRESSAQTRIPTNQTASSTVKNKVGVPKKPPTIPPRSNVNNENCFKVPKSPVGSGVNKEDHIKPPQLVNSCSQEKTSTSLKKDDSGNSGNGTEEGVV